MTEAEQRWLGELRVSPRLLEVYGRSCGKLVGFFLMRACVVTLWPTNATGVPFPGFDTDARLKLEGRAVLN